MTVSYISDSTDWNKAIDGARTKEQLVEAVQGWMPFVDDALTVAKGMDDRAFLEWRSGLRKERRRQFAGEAWANRFSALVIPEKFIAATGVAEKFHVPLGLALIRLQEAS